MFVCLFLGGLEGCGSIKAVLFALVIHRNQERLVINTLVWTPLSQPMISDYSLTIMSAPGERYPPFTTLSQHDYQNKTPCLGLSYHSIQRMGKKSMVYNHIYLTVNNLLGLAVKNTRKTWKLIAHGGCMFLSEVTQATSP